MAAKAKSEADKGTPIDVFYMGLRLDAKGEFVAYLQLCNPDQAPTPADREIAFHVPMKRVAGAQIGMAYTAHHKGSETWSFPVGGQWHRVRVEKKIAPAEDRATWEMKDRAARQERAAMKYRADDAIDRAMMPIASVYWRLTPAERTSFELFLIKTLRKSVV